MNSQSLAMKNYDNVRYKMKLCIGRIFGDEGPRQTFNEYPFLF